MISLLKVAVAIIALTASFALNMASNESVHQKGMQAGEVNAFLTRGNVVKSSMFQSTPKGDRLGGR